MMMTKNEKILKQDVLGRVTIPKEQREKLLDAFEASGMSGKGFAEEHGIHVQTFASWIQKRRRARGDYENEEMRRKLRMGKKRSTTANDSSATTPLNLIEVAIPSSTEVITPSLEVLLPGGVVVKVNSESQFGLLKSLLQELSC